MKRVIYDLGSNNGDNIPYYLKKSDVVVAVEANPLLCREKRRRFSNEIAAGRLHVENCVLTAAESEGEAYFYIHKYNHVLSQFPVPTKNIDDFDKILLPSKFIQRIISEYGDPFYVKVDIEHYDQEILRALFKEKIIPPYISAETHSIEVFSILLSLGGYAAYKLVDGSSVSEKYKDCEIVVNLKKENYSFPKHSAGPFGEDIRGDWMTADNFFMLLALEGLGWKDIHATNVCQANPFAVVNLDSYIKERRKTRIREGTISILRTFVPPHVKKVIKKIL